MKKTLLLLVLAFGICSINGSAQTKKRTPVKKTNIAKPATTSTAKERKVGNDGYIWYLLKKGNLYGAQDIEGRVIVPTQYDFIEYVAYGRGDHYYKVKKGDYYGVYTRLGNLLIPIDRHYTNIEMLVGEGKIAWEIEINGGRKGGLDAKGNEVLPPFYEEIGLESVCRGNDKERGAFFFIVKQSGKYGIYDLNGNKVVNPRYEEKYDCFLYDFDDEGPSNLNEFGSDGNYIRIQISGNTRYNYMPFDDLYYPFHYASTSSSSNSTSSSSSSSSSLSSSSSSSNSNSGTTTVVVEHKRDPVPVQDWVPCSVCGHNPGVCQTCVGNKTNYRGDPCISCRGTGKCHFCNGQGGRYQIVYR